MSSPLRIALAAAAVVVVAFVGLRFLPTQTVIPGTTIVPTPSATAPQTPAPTASPRSSGPQALPEGALAAGTYFSNPFPAPFDDIRVSFTVPAGWQGYPQGAMTPAAGPDGPTGAAVAAMRPRTLYVDPCNWEFAGTPTLPARESVDDLVDALVEIASGPDAPYSATTPEAITLSGYSGTHLDLQLPSDVDFRSCTGGTFWVWDTGPYAQGPGNRFHLWILDVDGTRVVIFAQDFAATSAKDRADLEGVLSSVRIER